MENDTLLARVQAHISDLQTNTSTSIEVRLFEEAELVLPEQISQPETFALVQQISTLLQNIQQNPAPGVNLLIRLLNPFRFSDVLAFDPPVDFASGLDLGTNAPEGMMLPFNRLMLVLLEKATLSASDAAIVAGKPEVFQALVRLWLCTPDTGIAQHAGMLLWDLLKVDREVVEDPDQHVPGGGQGLVWKRVFGDRDVYGAIFDVCGKGSGLGRNQRTLAQARLLEWLPKVAGLDWGFVAQSHCAEVEQKHDVQDGGLLQFAAERMVDFEGDVLMYRCLIDFYSEILDATLEREMPTITGQTSAGLEYLIDKALHDRTAKLYLESGQNSDPVDSMFLYGPAANYIATYASLYSQHFRASGMPKGVKDRLVDALSISSSRWAHAESPKHDLHLLASMPRATLLPSAEGRVAWASSPLSLIPSKNTNPDALNTLAVVFHGPGTKPLTFPQMTSAANEQTPEQELEAAAARALYLNYIADNPRFWSDIASHADTVALKDHALAALKCLKSVITANWSAKPSLSLPSNAIATPEIGHLAILSPPALEYTLPYLMKPPQTFSNLVGGRGDSESAAYKVAAAKYDSLQALHGRLAVLVEREPGQGYEEIFATLGKRLTEGPLSREGEVGGQIATMEL